MDLANGRLKLEIDLLGCLIFYSENGLGLTTEALLSDKYWTALVETI